MVLNLIVNFLLGGGWTDAVYFIAGGVGIICVIVILWFMLMFIFRMRKGSEKDGHI